MFYVACRLLGDAPFQALRSRPQQLAVHTDLLAVAATEVADERVSLPVASQRSTQLARRIDVLEIALPSYTVLSTQHCTVYSTM